MKKYFKISETKLDMKFLVFNNIAFILEVRFFVNKYIENDKINRHFCF